MKNRYKAIVFIYALFNCCYLHAQDTLTRKVLTMKEVFALALNNSVQLKVVQKYTELARQKTEIDKLYKLPGITSSLNYGYISNADIWTPSFSEHQKGHIPHQFTQLTVQAAEAIFRGGEINNSIRKSTLEEQVAVLSLEKSTQDIKFLVVAQYLDIYRAMNLKQVFINNAKLAENRLKNILVMKKQGMVTQNDVLRTQITLSDLQLAIRKTDNNIAILNKQLNIVTGQPDEARLIPDSTLLNDQQTTQTVEFFTEEAYKENHELKIAATENTIAETNIKLFGADRYPEIAVFTGSSLQRPFLNSIPSIDIFYNVWQAGIGIKYNISSIYQSPRKLKLGKIQLEQSKQKELLQRQNVGVEVSSRYIKYNEAIDELATLKSDQQSAEENYRIVEKKYFNQLALLTDLIDATSTKIEAETKVVNARINIVYTYYQLLKAVGTL
ncbi:TolC family protein [Mucilaginibacter celer]|uniref:TolC family protein n=1 Tax=Mucilaginibacter celer TaxID=2305508 RepID=A0A494VZ30_9SPHI|nr:TolC family protein [Mucilaginibacter celer]AYL96578.1 TolC family protein [Mucilaginibacter celer]